MNVIPAWSEAEAWERGDVNRSCHAYHASAACAHSRFCSMLAPPLILLYEKACIALTARFLLSFAIGGAFVPLVLAAATAPPHACCIRQAAHQCHGSFAATDQRAVRDTSCCRQDCCRAVRTSYSAPPQPRLASVLARHLNARILDFRAEASAAELLASQSPRAPPQVSIALT